MFSDALFLCMQYYKNTSVMKEKMSDEPSPQSEYFAYEFTIAIDRLINDAPREEDEALFLFEENFGDIAVAQDLEEPPWFGVGSVDAQSEPPSVESPSELSDSQPVQESSQSSWGETPTNSAAAIPLDEKIKIVNMQREHPNWKLPSIRANGGKALSRLDELTQWKKHIANGGTLQDKYNAIDEWTYDRFQEARNSGRPVYTRDLRVWALQAARQFESSGFKFKASRGWIIKFKYRHRIRMQLAAEDRQLHSREDAIKIQSLVHNQISVPIFKNMLQYAWYASGLAEKRETFFNVNQVCFSECCARKVCQVRDCESLGFMQCSWCQLYLCFSCFYDTYHPQSCSRKPKR
ncbi:hypothetical protein QAD02_014177 [Eretmocerus hayati]|uniref:Uncharacterized protein n=1 Tax=Eretmocerus hayati TaxID=131215 RepID=A0ACC2P9D2_9HYME|nr:hypothetical protein QAD02_014177 [Eretmocerus hayati]